MELSSLFNSQCDGGHKITATIIPEIVAQTQRRLRNFLQKSKYRSSLRMAFSCCLFCYVRSQRSTLTVRTLERHSIASGKNQFSRKSISISLSVGEEVWSDSSVPEMSLFSSSLTWLSSFFFPIQGQRQFKSLSPYNRYGTKRAMLLSQTHTSSSSNSSERMEEM